MKLNSKLRQQSLAQYHIPALIAFVRLWLKYLIAAMRSGTDKVDYAHGCTMRGLSPKHLNLQTMLSMFLHEGTAKARVGKSL